MKKLFLIGIFAFAILSVSPAEAAANANAAEICAENSISDNDGWEKLGVATARGVDEIHEDMCFEGDLYVKIIENKVFYRFVYQGKGYIVSNIKKFNDKNSNLANLANRGGVRISGRGRLTINNIDCKIDLPIVEA